MDFLQAERIIRERILANDFGVSGQRMTNMQIIAQKIACSYVTVTKAIESLCHSGLITLYGHCHYITKGRCAPDSELELHLKQKRISCFAVLVPSIENSYYTKVVGLLQQFLMKQGYDLLIMISNGNQELERRQMEMVLNLNLSGVFFFPHKTFKNNTYFEYFPLPVVAIGRQLNHFLRNTVIMNNYDIGKYAANHLYQRGYQTFYYIGFRQERNAPDKRLTGFREALEKHGIQLPNDQILLVDDDNMCSSIISCIHEFPVGQTSIGVFAYHDLIAYEILKACKQFSIGVPNQVGIIGCDNLPICQISSPTLSTICYQNENLVQKAFELIMGEVLYQTSESQLVVIQPNLIFRKSSMRIE